MLDLFIGVSLKDKDGNVVYSMEKRAESLLANFLRLLFGIMCSVQVELRKQDGTFVETGWVETFNTYDLKYWLKMGAGSGDASMGIVVGTGSSAVSIDDYSLESKIGHGTGAGQLQYGNTAWGDTTCEADHCEFTITRDFSNASGDSITVNEIGLISRTYDEDNKKVLIARDVISGGITVPNGQTLTVNYKFKVYL